MSPGSFVCGVVMGSPAVKRMTEMTVRGLILGILITLVFTAANVYLGLKVGLTFATSIPAAVISMAVLALFKDSSILENNIVQTVASAAGTLSAIIFVLPGLIIVGWWPDFPFWTSFWICAAGGVLGVLFTIPLRRAMVTHSDLPYPEGVAAAEVLEVGDAARRSTGEDKATAEGLMAVVWGSIASLFLAAFATTKIAVGEFTAYLKFGAKSATAFNPSFSLALLGAGYLVGLSVGMAMLFGLLIAWAAAVPALTFLAPQDGAAIGDFVHGVWLHKVRFIGAGAIGVAAIWTLTKLAGPVVGGVIGTLKSSKTAKETGDTRDLDMQPMWIGIIAVVSLAITAVLLKDFLAPTLLAGSTIKLIACTLPFIFVGGFLVAAITGYMAGLIGASNSPISGVGILAIVICAALLVAVAQPPVEVRPALVAFSLFATAIVFSIATISNNNLQDLKTGQLVGATPRAQQWALIVGVIAGAAVIPPVLDLLAQAFGFAGQAHLPHGADQALGAPQANLISALAQGVIQQNLDWGMIGLGAGLGVLLILIDEGLGKMKWLRLPPLAVGIGIYLPMSATLPVVIGAVIGAGYDRWTKRTPDPERAKRLAVLVASGMIVGESLFGVALAGLIVATGKESPLALVSDGAVPAPAIGSAAFLLLILWLYGWMMRRAKRPL
jgi:putative OPT family oligopeptide transporter